MSLHGDQIIVALSVVGVSYAFGDVQVWSWVGCGGGAILAASVMTGSGWARVFRWFISFLAAVLFMPALLQYWHIHDPGMAMSMSALFAFVIWAFLSLWTTDGAIAARALWDRALAVVRGPAK